MAKAKKPKTQHLVDFRKQLEDPFQDAQDFLGDLWEKLDPNVEFTIGNGEVLRPIGYEVFIYRTTRKEPDGLILHEYGMYDWNEIKLAQVIEFKLEPS